MDPVTGSECAMKVIPMIRRGASFFEREALALDQCRHLNVVHMHGWWQEVLEHQGVPTPHLIILTELCRGSLHKYLREFRGIIPISQIQHFFSQMLQGVAFIHSKGFIHRDLKPANILIAYNGCLKIGDFGLSKQACIAHGAHTPQLFTIYYRPPEVLLGSTSYGQAGDLWSLGCILAELFCGRPLFAGKSEIEQLLLINDAFGPLSRETLMCAEGELPVLNNFRFPVRKGLSLWWLRLGAIFARDTRAMFLALHLLSINPHERKTCTDALQHAFFADFWSQNPGGIAESHPSSACATASVNGQVSEALPSNPILVEDSLAGVKEKVHGANHERPAVSSTRQVVYDDQQRVWFGMRTAAQECLELHLQMLSFCISINLLYSSIVLKFGRHFLIQMCMTIFFQFGKDLKNKIH